MIFQDTQLEPCVTVHTMSPEGCLGAIAFNGGNIGLNGFSSATWPSANSAIFEPFFLSKQITVSTLFTWNGATTNGNMDIGIYSEDGTLLVSSGSTAQSGTSTLQTFTVTTTTLGPGIFYLALVMNNTTGTIRKGLVGQVLKTKLTGMAQMNTAFPLPATATFASIGQDSVPLIGLSTRSTI